MFLHWNRSRTGRIAKRWLILGCLAAGLSAQGAMARAGYRDDAFLTARDAFRQGDVIKFDRAAQQVGDDHALAAYIDTWRFRLTQIDTGAVWPEMTVTRILDQHAGTLAAELLRRDWLLNLAKRQEWTTFRRQWAKLLTRDDPSLQCLNLLADMATGISINSQARPLLLSPKELPEGCVLLGERMFAEGKLTREDLLQRIRTLTEANQRATARRVYEYLIAFDSAGTISSLSNFDQAYDRPPLFLASLPLRLTNAQQELATLAIARVARDNPEDAARWIGNQFVNRLSDNQKSWAWGQVGLGAARKWHPRALEWYGYSSADTRSEENNEWYVRAALLARNWKLVQHIVDLMPPAQRGEPSWTYWQGRALQAQGNNEGARQQFQSIGSPFSFYGTLALEELGKPAHHLPQSPAASPAELQTAARLQGLQRALLWYQMGQRNEGFREFNFTLLGMRDRQLLAAAEWARHNGLYDRAIAAADRTQNEHDASLRFLTPFREVMQTQTQLAGLDEAWAYGLIRQESRFIIAARSSVGASGLMQLMPATAQMVAKKIGMVDYTKDKVNDINVNVQLGVNYLRMMLDQLDNSMVLASAGYNAGPGRPRDWRTRLPAGESIEGAIFAEAIPFNETRDYVKKVLSNTTHYAALFENRPQSLKARLGVIIGRGGSETQRLEKVQ
ncbi:MAG: transglycosylase SLT domain-containing protein [Burkholderiaceae bacterium]